MARPLLQVALDNKSLPEAFKQLSGGLGDAVDIIECGTVLILCEGVRAIRTLRNAYPDKTLVADFKLLSRTFSPIILAEKPDIITIFSRCPDIEKEAMYKQACEAGATAQIELHGDWTWEDIERWRGYGIKSIIYGKPRTDKGPWRPEAAEPIRRLTDMGWEVTVTGGVTYEDLDVLAGLPIYGIICGGAIRNAPSPVAEAKRIKARIAELWPE